MSTWGTQNISEAIDIIVYFLVIKDGLPAPTCFNKDIINCKRTKRHPFYPFNKTQPFTK